MHANPASAIVRWRDAGAIRPIDSARLAEWENLFPALKAVAVDRETGPPWMVPFDRGNGSILYRDGMLTWFCGLVPMRNRNCDDATRYEFLDAMLAPETGLWPIESFGFGHSDAKSFELAGPDLAAALALPVDPAAMFAKTVVMPPMQPDVRQKYIAMLEEAKIAF